MTAAATSERTRHVEQCMGTVFSFDLRDEGTWTEAIDDAVGWLHRVDRLFSTYRADSDISRLRRGELRLADADPLITEVLDLCAAYEEQTSGAFSAHWNGAPDPTGLVKGWAVERASDILRGHGSGNHAVNGGGDVQTSGEAAPGVPWRIGIADPDDRQRVLATFSGRGIAVATSGTVERGAHIIDPRTGRPGTGLASVTVSGRSLTEVDVLATAAFVLGDDAAPWLSARRDLAALIVGADGSATRLQALAD